MLCPSGKARAAPQEFRAMSISGDYITCKGKNKRGNWCHRLRWRKYEGAKYQELNFTRPTKKASRDAAQDHRDKLRRREIGDGVSFESLVERWRSERMTTCKKSTRAEYDRFLRVYIEPVFADRKDAASISPSDIQDFNEYLIANGRPAGVRGPCRLPGAARLPRPAKPRPEPRPSARQPFRA